MKKSNGGVQLLEILLVGAMVLCVGIFATLAFEDQIFSLINSNSSDIIVNNNSQ